MNIVVDQIEKVDPVVLKGVANTNGGSSVAKKRSNPLKNLLARFFGFFSFILALVVIFALSLVLARIFKGIGGFTVVAFITIAVIGVIGYFIYKRYEKNEFISPKVFKRLNFFPPVFISKFGSDEAIRVSLPSITVYLFGDEQLYMYYQYFDIVTGKIFCEGVHEYFYEDIVGVISSQETNKLFKRRGFMNMILESHDYLKEHISVVTKGCTHEQTYIVDTGASLLDTQFIGMRNLIRQKKAEK